MPDNETYLCSDLVQLTAGGSKQIANLDAIGPWGCTVFTSQPLPKGKRVRMTCMECPAGKKNCASCLIRGRILSAREGSPLGVEQDVRFDGAPWSVERWSPRHLTNVQEAVTARKAAIVQKQE
jgi:hypothetical protein